MMNPGHSLWNICTVIPLATTYKGERANVTFFHGFTYQRFIDERRIH